MNSQAQSAETEMLCDPCPLSSKRDEHWEQGVWNTLQQETPSPSTAQLPDNKKEYSCSLFSPDIFLRIVYPADAAEFLLHQAGAAFSTRAGQEKRWEFSWWLITSARLDFLGASSTTYKNLLITASPACSVT